MSRHDFEKISLELLRSSLQREALYFSTELAGKLAFAFAEYIAAVSVELRWDSETFSALAANVESIMREHAPHPPAPKDVEV